MLSKIVFKLEISQHCFIGVLLLHNVMLVSAVQQSGSAICTHMSPVSWASFPPLSPRPIITQLPVLHRSFPLATLVYTRHCLYVNATLPTHPTPLFPLWVHVRSLYPRFYSCLGNRFICTIFKGSVLFTLLEKNCSNLVHCLVLTLKKAKNLTEWKWCENKMKFKPEIRQGKNWVKIFHTPSSHYISLTK